VRIIAGAIVILADSVLVAAGALGQIIQLTAGENANIHLTGVAAMMPLGTILSLIGLIILVSGFWENRPNEPRL
jgi:hypothetical protein